MTTHQLRHWLNHIADKGGLPVELQTRWLGRENARDTEAYRHSTVSERLEWVKAGMRDGTLGGVKSDVYFELPLAQREAFLDGEIQAVHFTGFGICLHDFAVTPCPFHLNCVRGCPDYLRTRGNQKERQHLIQIRTGTEEALVAARLQAASGAGIAEPWVSASISARTLFVSIRGSLSRSPLCVFVRGGKDTGPKRPAAALNPPNNRPSFRSYRDGNPGSQGES